MNEAELIKYIQTNFIYNSDGTFTRSDRKNSAGSYDKDGYLITKIKGKQYKTHRLVYAYFNGRFPSGEIDHINRNRVDNRIENLRDVTRADNVHNTTILPNPRTGVIGVYVDNTPGLKKKFAFKFKDKSYRCYTLQEAVDMKAKLKESAI